MTLKEFKSSLMQAKPPDSLSEALKALWYDAQGDWDKAHKIAQEIHNSDGAWVHAYLHRKEGDESNSQYWYSHAGRKFSNLTLEEEWDEIAKALLKSNS